MWIEVGGVRGWWNETRNEWETKRSDIEERMTVTYYGGDVFEINRIAMAMNECLKAHGFETEGTAETLLMVAQEWVEAGCPLTKNQ